MKLNNVASFFIGLIFGFVIITSWFVLILYFPPGSGIQTLPINIIYEDNQANYAGEMAMVSATEAFEGTTICVLFYNLSLTRTYCIIDGHNQNNKITEEFNESESIFIYIAAEKDSSLFLANVPEGKSYLQARDLIWIWIGEFEP